MLCFTGQSSVLLFHIFWDWSQGRRLDHQSLWLSLNTHSQDEGGGKKKRQTTSPTDSVITQVCVTCHLSPHAREQSDNADKLPYSHGRRRKGPYPRGCPLFPRRIRAKKGMLCKMKAEITSLIAVGAAANSCSLQQISEDDYKTNVLEWFVAALMNRLSNSKCINIVLYYSISLLLAVVWFSFCNVKGLFQGKV